jgi:hypothetical protein
MKTVVPANLWGQSLTFNTFSDSKSLHLSLLDKKIYLGTF